MLKYSLAILPMAILFGSSQMSAQVPGTIYSPPSKSAHFLDPNADGYITKQGTPLELGLSELSQFEGNWEHWFQVHSEPAGDNHIESSCSSFDVVDAENGDGALYIGTYDPDGYPSNNDGDEYFLARLRLAEDPAETDFGFSILIDADNEFGDGNDLSATGYNAGYEIEIRYKNGTENGGIFLDDIDGFSEGITKVSYPYEAHQQKSFARQGLQNCESQSVFIDIGIPFSDLKQYFNVEAASFFRLVCVTTSDGKSALKHGFADLVGIDGGIPEYRNNFTAMSELLNLQPVNRPLPVSLTRAEIVKEQEQHRLVWETASEVNTERFEIEASSNGFDFSFLAALPAQGNPVVGATYSFHDLPKAIPGTPYFLRLKIIDFDHSFSYSETLELSAQNKQSQVIELFPNPAKSHVSFQHKELVNGIYKIYDQSAMLVLDGEFQNNSPIDISSLRPGAYYVCFHHEGKIEQQRLLVK